MAGYGISAGHWPASRTFDAKIAKGKEKERRKEKRNILDGCTPLRRGQVFRGIVNAAFTNVDRREMRAANGKDTQSVPKAAHISTFSVSDRVQIPV